MTMTIEFTLRLPGQRRRTHHESVPRRLRLALVVMALLVLASLGGTPASAQPSGGTNPLERCLLGFKATLTDPDARLGNWRTRNPFGPCSWAGVDCLSLPPPQVQLDLHSFGLSAASDALQLAALAPCAGGGTSTTVNSTTAVITSLLLWDNRLSGPIPGDLCRLMPALVTLDLSRNALTGPVPPELGECAALRELQLGSNDLEGPVPPELGLLPALRLLNVSGNARVTGPLPGSLRPEGRAPDQPPLTVYADPGVLGVPQYEPAAAPAEGPGAGDGHSSFVRVVAAAALAATVSVGVAVSAVCWWRGPAGARVRRSRLGRTPVRTLVSSRARARTAAGAGAAAAGAVPALASSSPEDLEAGRRSPGAGQHSSPQQQQPERRLLVRDLWATTGCFDKEHEIGSGGFSTVYRAQGVPGLGDVAVKWLNKEQKLGPQRQERAFRRELAALISIRHRNLVQILGYVAKSDLRLLLLEYMPNGSLDQQLHGVASSSSPSHEQQQQQRRSTTPPPPPYVCPLTWQRRCDIALGIAMGLDYLHRGIRNPLLHLDLKPSNILLDARMVARIADFGLAKLVSQANITSHTLFWTAGYTAPEVVLGARGTSTKADVYSFGVLLLELITRQKPSSSVFGDGVTLVGWVKQALDTNTLHTVVDPVLTIGGLYNIHAEEMTVLCKLGLFCAQPVAAARPDMATVVDVLARGARQFPPALANDQKHV